MMVVFDFSSLDLSQNGDNNCFTCEASPCVCDCDCDGGCDYCDTDGACDECDNL